MRSLPRLVALGSMPLLAACSFLLDFNGLQGGHKPSPDAGAGTGGAEAGTDSGSPAGTPGECDASSCDDADPCTVDTCSTSGCTHAFSPGLGLEADFAPILADAQYRVTMTAGSDAFYFSTFSTTAKKSEVEIFRLGEDDADYASLKKISSFPAFTGAPVSVAGLAVDTSGALGESLRALVAVANGSGVAQVWALAADGQQAFGIPTKVGDSYSADVPYNYPLARALNGVVHGAWINADGTMSVLSPGSTSAAKFGVGAPAAGVLTLIGTDTYQPALVFSGKTNGVYLETAGGNRSAMPECQTAVGGYLSMSATALAGHNGIWFAGWTKYATGLLTDESHLVICANGACQPDTTTQCKGTDSDNFERNGVIESVHLPGDPAEQSYVVAVTPALTPDADGGTPSSTLTAFLARLNSPLDKTGTTTAIGSALSLASLPATADNVRGPDFPALAVIPGAQVKVALAWIQPPASGSGSDAVHLQRYRMCLPKP